MQTRPIISRVSRPTSSWRSDPLRIAPADTIAVADRLQKGLPTATLDQFQKDSGFSLETIARTIQIPLRTLHRRRLTGRLRSEESDRLYRFANLFQKSVELFDGDRDAARQWLSQPAKALGDRVPLEFARSEVGARAVEDLIGQLEHGVYP